MKVAISVVVPIYNVEPYLLNCLTSIAHQSYRHLQVVLVDDGSTDGSAAIAQRFAQQDSRFVLLRQPNAGLGAARNAGVRRATGEFLAFVDSDDVLPPNALRVLQRSLAASGSDFATGLIGRFGSHGRISVNPAPVQRSVRRTHVSQTPQLLRDRFVTNKLWRRTFWEGAALTFPEGVLYEDVVVCMGGHFAARSVDVLREVVYWWRRRSGGTASITENRAVPSGVVDRVEALLWVRAEMARRGMDDLRAEYDKVVLANDLRFFVNVADLGDAAYRESLVQQTRFYLAGVDPSVLQQLHAIERLKYHFLSRGMTDELLETLAFQRLSLDTSRVLRRPGGFYGDYPYRSDRSKAVPAEVYRLGPELQVRAHIHTLEWAGKQLHVSGYAYIDRLDVPHPRAGTIRLYARDERDGRRQEIPLQRHRDPEASHSVRQGNHRYDGAGFTAEFNPSPLFGAGVEEATLTLIVEVECRGVTKETAAWTSPLGRSLVARRRAYREGHHLRARLSEGAFTVDVERVTAIVDSLDYANGQLIVTGKVRPGAQQPMLTARRAADGVTRRRPLEIPPRTGRQWNRFRVAWPVEDLAPGADLEDEPSRDELQQDGLAWHVLLSAKNGRPVAVAASPRVMPAGAFVRGREFVFRTTLGGHLGLVERLPHPTASAASWEPDGTLRLKGLHRDAGQRLSLCLRHRDSGRTRHLGDAVADGTLDVCLPVHAAPGLAGPRPLDDGVWELHGVGESAQATVPLLGHRELLATLPSTLEHGGRRYTLRQGAKESLLIEAEPAEVLSRWQQEQLQRRGTVASRSRRIRDVVLFTSWGGGRCGGDPRALYDQLQRSGDAPAAIWVGRGGQIAVDGADVVDHGSREHVEALARARWVVTDHLLPRWWQPRRGQRVLQTWHGTPVKRTGFALPSHIAAASSVWLRELQRQAAAWDLVLSSTPEATQRLREALRFAGEVVEVGAPRNDVFHRESGMQTQIEQLRGRLGLRESQRVVLWTPTARDEGWTGRTSRRLRVALDVADHAAGDEWVFLIHGHPTFTEAVAPGSTWRDVTEYPNVHDLLAIADVLVTDYSSLALDYLHTMGPLVLYAPDLEDFAGERGGLAVDMTQRPPGPVTRTSEAAWDAVQHADDRRGTYVPAYMSLLETYGGPRDGRAGERALERLFAP